ncbi:hypothetical protein D3C73_1122700 [compost metagenome]
MFRPVDKKALARECKVLLESGIVDHMRQLSIDLSNYKEGTPPATHVSRLNNFAKEIGLVYGPRKVVREEIRRPVVLATGPFDFRAELSTSFSKALRTGMPMATLMSHAQEVLVDCNYQVQAAKATTGLQELMRDTGMSASQIAQIAHAL